MEVWKDDPDRLKEMDKEEKDAKVFGITVEQLRQQRRELGQLLTGPYAGCSPGFVQMMETDKWLGGFFKEVDFKNLSKDIR